MYYPINPLKLEGIPKIYDLKYDLLVRNPSKEIKSLIDWIGWE
tara:strand:- start:133 stop:261 length:129 start_codon:yes stop_codon:yes gene_type:complete